MQILQSCKGCLSGIQPAQCHSRGFYSRSEVLESLSPWSYQSHSGIVSIGWQLQDRSNHFNNKQRRTVSNRDTNFLHLYNKFFWKLVHVFFINGEHLENHY